MTVANEQFEFLMDLDVEPLTSLNDIRLAVHEKLSNESKLPEYVTSTDLIRVRQKTKTRVTTILRDGSLRENQIALYSNRELAIEVCLFINKFIMYCICGYSIVYLDICSSCRPLKNFQHTATVTSSYLLAGGTDLLGLSGTLLRFICEDLCPLCKLLSGFRDYLKLRVPRMCVFSLLLLTAKYVCAI